MCAWKALRFKISAGTGSEEEGKTLSAGNGESWEAFEQGSDMVGHRPEKGPSGL